MQPHYGYGPMSHVHSRPVDPAEAAAFENDGVSFPLSLLPRSHSMDASNDPRFLINSVVAKRLAAFQTICVVAVLMVNLSVKQMFALESGIDGHSHVGTVQYVGFCLMTLVFLMDLTTVIVLIQQMFMTYRLLTAGPTGFEIGKSFYLNANIVSMRHKAVQVFFFSLPLFVAATSCMVYTAFVKAGVGSLAYPVVALLGLAALALWYVNHKHSVIFKEKYRFCKAHEEPMITRMNMGASAGSPHLDV